MPEFGSTGQDAPEPSGITESDGRAEDGPAGEPGEVTVIGVVTGSQAVIPPGVDADLPDDADDAADGVPPPRSSSRVTPDENVIPSGRRRKSVRRRWWMRR